MFSTFSFLISLKFSCILNIDIIRQLENVKFHHWKSEDMMMRNFKFHIIRCIQFKGFQYSIKQLNTLRYIKIG